jgi:hypothetical protein
MPEIAAAMKRIRAARDSVLVADPRRLHHHASLADVRRVVVINSASRSGSSLLYALLAKLPGVCSPTGEANPFYKLNTRYVGFDPHVSDRIPDGLLGRVVDFGGLERDFLADIWPAGEETETSRIDDGRYCDDLLLRLLLQWTDIPFDLAELRDIITGAFAAYAEGHPRFDTTEFYLHLLGRLHAVWPMVNPFYYDIGTDRVALRFPFFEVPAGPPVSGFTIEEPPFVLLPPRRSPAPGDLADTTLLLKSTVDCYRMNLIERLFPNAEIRVIHLVRNPAATINGLYDGWLHRGFYSHNLAHRFGGDQPERLHIAGYSDRYPHGSTWWNFDLPPGWGAMVNCDLVEVCAFQWRAANREIIDYLAGHVGPVTTVRFEDLIRSPESRRDAFERLLAFMSQPADVLALLGLDELPVVQSTLPPQLYRWKKRSDMISRVLDAPDVLEMAARFGYFRENMEQWL